MTDKAEDGKARLLHHLTIPLSIAQLALRAALDCADAISVPVNISIVSDSLHLLAFARMDGAKLTSVDVAHNKAFTAAGHRLDTDDYGPKVRGHRAVSLVEGQADG